MIMKKLLALFFLLLPALSFGQEFIDGHTPLGTDSLWLRYIGTTSGTLIIDGALAVDQTPAASSRILLINADTGQVIGEGVNGTYLRGGYTQNRAVGLRSGDTTSFTLTPSGRVQIKGILPDAGPVTCFWKTSANSTEIVNTASQTEFSDSIAISPGGIEAGMTLRFKTYFTAGHSNATPTCNLRLKYNAEVLGSITFPPAAVSGSASPISIEWTVVVSGNTTTRTTVSMHYFDGNTYKIYEGMTDATLSVTDFTDAGRFAFSAQWSAASVMNKITMKQVVADYTDAQ